MMTKTAVPIPSLISAQAAAANTGAAMPTESATLLDNIAEQSALPARHAYGIATGELIAIREDGQAIVQIPSLNLQQCPARSLIPLTHVKTGTLLALGFEGGNAALPVILGLMMSPETGSAAAPDQSSSEVQKDTAGDAAQIAETDINIVADGTRVILTAEREIELRCGEAAIILSADGRIQIRGNYITSHASITQRILGGSVNVN